MPPRNQNHIAPFQVKEVAGGNQQYIYGQTKGGWTEAKFHQALRQVQAAEPGKQYVAIMQIPSLVGVEERGKSKDKKNEGWIQTAWSKHMKADGSIDVEYFRETLVDYDGPDGPTEGNDANSFLWALRNEREQHRPIRLVIVARTPLANAGGRDASGTNDCLLELIDPEGDHDASRAAMGLELGSKISLVDLPVVEEHYKRAIVVDRVLDCRTSTTNYPPVHVRLAAEHYTAALPERESIQPVRLQDSELTGDCATRTLCVHADVLVDDEKMIMSCTAEGSGKARQHYVRFYPQGRFFSIAKDKFTRWQLTKRDASYTTERQWTEDNIKAKYDELFTFVGLLHRRLKEAGVTVYNPKLKCRHGPNFLNAPKINYAIISKALWQHYVPRPVECPSAMESAIICNTMSGALIWNKQRGLKLEDAASLDVTSLYPTVMHRQRYPEGIPEIVEHTEVGDRLACVRIRISREECVKESPPRFRYSPSGWYTTVDLEQMKKHGYTHEVWGKALVWPGSTRDLFTKYVEQTFAWKKTDRRMKSLTTTLWGSLTERNSTRTVPENGAFFLKDVDVNSRGEVCEALGYDLNQKLYKFAPQIGMFVIAYGRNYMNCILDVVGRDRVVNVQTDGCLIDCSLRPPPTCPNNGKLGSLKLESRGRLDLRHINQWKMFAAADGEVIQKCGRDFD
jgi:hypothetical protein